MKKFFLYAGALILIVFVSSFALATVLDQVYKVVRTGQTGGKINDYLAKQPQPEIVIMGDSRALYQVIPDSFPLPTYSLTHAGMTQSFQTALYDVISQQHAPRIVLLQLSPLEYLTAGASNSVQNLKYYHGRNDTVTKYINGISRFEKYKYWLDLYRYNGRVIPMFKNVVTTYMQSDYGNGYVPSHPSPLDSIHAVMSAQNDPFNGATRFYYDQLPYLTSFIKLCQQNNTQLICFSSPVYHPPASFLRVTTVLDSLLTANNVPYIDYIGQPLLPQLQRRGVYWNDNRHLNEIGGAIQSQHLAAQVSRLLMPVPATQEVATQPNLTPTKP